MRDQTVFARRIEIWLTVVRHDRLHGFFILCALLTVFSIKVVSANSTFDAPKNPIECGPFVGHVEDSRAMIWARFTEGGDYRLVFGEGLEGEGRQSGSEPRLLCDLGSRSIEPEHEVSLFRAAS